MSAAGSSARNAILFVLPWQPDAAGGVNRVVLSLIEGFAQDGAYRPLLLVNEYPQRRVTRKTQAGLPPFYEYFLPAPCHPRSAAKSVLAYLMRLPVALWRFIRLIRRDKVVAVNLHYPGLSAFTVLLARFITFGAFKVVLSFHGADLPRRDGDRLQRLIWRFIFRHTDAVVACSHALADELRQTAAPIPRLHVVHNAVDSAACRCKAQRSALPAGLASRRYLLSVGKFEDKKAHDVLIESFESVAPQHPNLYLAIIGGSGPALTASERRVAASPFKERMLLYRDLRHGSTLAAIAHAELFVLPSRREPFGIVLLEAAALGTPIVASRVGGIPEIIEDGSSGVLVTPNDVQALSDALQQALELPKHSKRRTARLREKVLAKFPLTAQVGAYRRFFDGRDTLKRKGPVSPETPPNQKKAERCSKLPK
jgi:glycosyltransferase involved in cell wall biosynthesis